MQGPEDFIPLGRTGDEARIIPFILECEAAAAEPKFGEDRISPRFRLPIKLTNN
jgi:hypothetical protein